MIDQGEAAAQILLVGNAHHPIGGCMDRRAGGRVARVHLQRAAVGVFRARGVARGGEGHAEVEPGREQQRRVGGLAGDPVADLVTPAQRLRVRLAVVVGRVRRRQGGGMDAASLAQHGGVAEEVADPPFRIALPEAHPLAAHESLDLHQLAGEQFVVFPRRIAPPLHDTLIALCRDAGFPLDIAPDVHETEPPTAEEVRLLREQIDPLGNRTTTVFDDAGQKDRLDCLLPDIAGYVVSPQARGSELLVQVMPNPNDEINNGDMQWLAKEFPDAAKHVAAMTAGLPSTIVVKDQAVEGGKAAGMTIVADIQYNANGENTWAPIVQALKSKGVKGILWTGEPENLAKLEQGLKDANYPMDFIRPDANHYDQKLLDTGGKAIENTFVHAQIYPFEQAAENPATQQYLDLFEKYLPNGKAQSYLGVQAFSAWLLFATAAGPAAAHRGGRPWIIRGEISWAGETSTAT